MTLLSIFLRLIAAHQIADFPLQTNWVFAIRLRYAWGSLVHVGLHLIVYSVLMLPYALYWQYWASLGLLGLSHFFIDKIKKNNIWIFIVDQLMHVVIMATQVWLLKDCVPAILPESVLAYYLNDQYWIWILTALLATFTTTIILYFFKMTWRGDYSKRGIFGFEKYFGAFSRFIVYAVTAAIVCFRLWYFFPVVFAIPLLELIYIDHQRKDKPHHNDIHPADIIVGTVFAIGLGVWAGLV
jgi:hypothetical protein